MQLTDGGNGGDDLAELQLIQDGRFTSSIKTHLQAAAWVRLHPDLRRMANRQTVQHAGRTMRIRISFLEKSLAKSFVKANPMIGQATAHSPLLADCRLPDLICLHLGALQGPTTLLQSRLKTITAVGSGVALSTSFTPEQVGP